MSVQIQSAYATPLALLLIASTASAVPIPSGRTGEAISDRANFLPYQKHLAMPGKIIAVLVTEAGSLLAAEGRTGPADQLCVGWNGGSYRWVYVPAGEKALIGNLQMPLPDGKMKVYSKVSMASPALLKSRGVETLYALVEMEVNDGVGSPATDSFVATKITRLDGTKDFPIDVAAVVADLKKRYESYLLENAKDLDAMMDQAAQKAIKVRKPTGPREKSTLMFVTWMPETEKLVVCFRSKIIDGDYKYANGIAIEFGPAPVQPGPVKGGALKPAAFKSLRYGTQFGIDFGSQFEVSKAGKIEKVRSLPPEAFTKELPRPALSR